MAKSGYENGLDRVCIVTSITDAASPPKDLPQTGIRAAILTDLNGNIIELIQKH